LANESFRSGVANFSLSATDIRLTLFCDRPTQTVVNPCKLFQRGEGAPWSCV
jgi:hypothetical protein